MKYFYLLYFLLFVGYAQAQEVIPLQATGGSTQLKHFIAQELIYPDSCLQNGIEGIVTIRFATDNTGKVIHYQANRLASSACVEEAMRIFKMIEWQPARHMGIPQPDSADFTIEFNQKKYRRLVKQRGYSMLFYPYEPMDTSGVIYNYNDLQTAPRPIFTNENISLSGFIAANLHYPEDAIKQNLNGVVKVGFIVEPHGKVSNLHIIKSLGAGCNEETIRLVNLLKWTPGTYEHLAVRTRMTLSIVFSLDNGINGQFNPTIKSSYGG